MSLSKNGKDIVDDTMVLDVSYAFPLRIPRRKKLAYFMKGEKLMASGFDIHTGERKDICLILTKNCFVNKLKPDGSIEVKVKLC